MKNLIILALDEAYNTLQSRSIPQTKKITKSVSVLDMKPIELLSYMKDNNIPDDAYFDGEPNGYDGFMGFLLCWEIEVPTKDEEKLSILKKSFKDIAFKNVFKTLTNNGYKRVSPDGVFLRNVMSLDIYEMYMNKDFDGLVSYYSGYFVKVLDN